MEKLVKMVAVIKTGHSIHRILNYNENKVKEGVAECISASNYPMDVKQLVIYFISGSGIA